jgi:glycosyltransferase involved in cell wall biosynthesis
MDRPIERAIEYGSSAVSPSEVRFESGRLGDAKATVCITLYNYENFILDALHSVYDQTLDELGLVVLDDCSSDFGLRRVERWLGEYGERFAGTCVLRHQVNRGLGVARNGAIARAQSDFIMILDADNELYPRCVERLLSGIEGTDFGFAYSILERFGEQTGLMGTLNWDPELLRVDNYIDAMALIRKDLWEAIPR